MTGPALDDDASERGPLQRAQKLAGRVDVVTGANSGIGQAIALGLAMEGADVGVTYNSDAAGAGETADEIGRYGRRALVHQVDVRDETSVAGLFDAVESALGKPHVLVDCAGLNGGGAPVAEIAAEDFGAVIRTDLYGPFFCCREFIRRRTEAGPGGKIVNVTSVHERIPSPSNAAYGAAKGGLLTLTRSLALELAPQRINVNAIAPGQIRTPMTEPRIDDPELHSREMRQIPWHRPGESWEVARLSV